MNESLAKLHRPTTQEPQRLPLWIVLAVWLALYLVQGVANAWSAEPAQVEPVAQGQKFMSLTPTSPKGKVYRQAGKFFPLKREPRFFRLAPREGANAAAPVKVEAPAVKPATEKVMADAEKTHVARGMQPTSFSAAAMPYFRPGKMEARELSKHTVRASDLKERQVQHDVKPVAVAKTSKDKAAKPLSHDDRQAILAIFTPDMPATVHRSEVTHRTQPVKAQPDAKEEIAALPAPRKLSAKTAPTFILPGGKTLAFNDEK